MAAVYFSKSIEKIIQQIDFSKLGNKVAIKISFGEKGCTTYIDPELVRKVYAKIKSLGKEATLVECNVLYRGSRTNSTDHIKTAREHGFTGMDIDILDGENGEEFVELKGCKIGKGIKKYNSLVVVSHFKGHMGAGFGGALKNVGMGLGSRAGKLDMHSKVQPFISDGCVACGKCIKHCNANAIAIINGKAKIDEKKCVGCAMCIAFCPQKAVEVPWQGRTSAELQKRIAEYARGVLSIFPEAVFINVLENITVNCDCMGFKQKPMMEDVGILFSRDIVAIDQASLDLANRFSANKFKAVNDIDKNKQVELAEKLGLGQRKYDLIEI